MYGNDAGDVVLQFLLETHHNVTNNASVAVEFDACASDYDTWLRVIDPVSLNELCGCSDCGGCAGAGQRRLTCELQPGLYYLIVEGYRWWDVNYNVDIACSGTSRESEDDRREEDRGNGTKIFSLCNSHSISSFFFGHILPH